MGLTIAWRNTRPVQTIKRCTRVTQNDSCARYFVEELIGGALEETWVDTSIMEIRRRGNLPEPGAEEPTISISLGAGSKEKTVPNAKFHR
jgi:hypothetical protein